MNADSPGVGTRRAGQKIACGWCGAPVTVPWRGRTPKWCSPSCRTRAWAARRAAEEGDVPVQIFDRPVEVVREVKVVQEVVREVQIKTRPRNSVEWAELLDDLAERLDDGRIYDRSLEDVAYHVDEVVRALNRRLKARR